MATSSNPIVFYDIAQRPPVTETCCAVNPWKSRLALNFKAVPYTTSWVKMPDISKVRSGLKVPACRKFADGSDFNTLPIIHDPATNIFVGDSFEIAVYLQHNYPTSGAGNLFPPQKLDYVFNNDIALVVPLSELSETDFVEYARFNTSIDAAFSPHTALMCQGLPLDPETAEITKADFVKRAGVRSWDDFALVGEAREKMKESFEAVLGDIAKLFLRNTSGPFLLGQQASYADFIVGGWLRMMRVTLPQSEWEEARGWHGGIFGQLHDGLDKYAEVK
ncbi:Uncharacterized protein BP5553_00333 [Venustampulla echinocandica]|uniref:Glutathione S-transferase UstS-like C-terminal domain-containing protein n=1 Tax=Venustampulla echinocandica TaxID=2656787 RepID=A0A370TXV3_9HELO|nr:Uncharacterized protein BP5553_00333 [Venustampulla echinocandica]RDL40354.1 Uncharacterized protein BP5553_00333 [Venustampulla echinocandica]